ncbi:hypothetical protein [Paraglaciecola sp. L3A3]|uniref:hypothetical protein n=1 Tax=Paraglaciecola sp. L3A3 TaxID=2686358 RepID=UPI00131BB0EC|nr:hypothetical protein [Paraglaciecola sp. L3A3]
MKLLLPLALLFGSLMSCEPSKQLDQSNQIKKSYGHWVKEKNGEITLDPQPSGLTTWRDKLVMLSDRSADPSQRLKLRTVDPKNATLVGPDMKMQLSASALDSCFADYVSDNPDLESLAKDPDKDTIFYMTSEDATSASPMSEMCQKKYKKTGSTDYPRLLIRLEVESSTKVLITHIRPIQFNDKMAVGNFPNDGIEALTFGKNRTLYLGIEKDSAKKARIFSLQLDETFWQTDDFAAVSEVMVKLPIFKGGNHPINGMDFYQTPTGKEFLIAAARNDETLWIIDLAGKKDARIVPINFYAEIINGTGVCQRFEEMDNTSIEGVAIIKDTLWLINDPWKAVYLNNISCPQNKRNYQRFSPLLFSLAIQQSWFE